MHIQFISSSNLPLKFPSSTICCSWFRINMIFSQIRHWKNFWTAGGQAFHQSSCSCAWCHWQVLFYFNLNEHYFSMCLKIIPFFSASDTWIHLVHGSLSIEIQWSKAFLIKQICITFTQNQCMFCLHNHYCKA